MIKRKVILITDGDRVAKKTVEDVARRVGARCISASAGNPTPLSGAALADLICQAAHDPVLVMFDDCGSQEIGKGERALEVVAGDPRIEVLGVVAVASDARKGEGAPVDIALDRDGNVVHHEVDKNGKELSDAPLCIHGDTVDVLNRFHFPVVVGIGDIGKMEKHDDRRWGAPVTTKAIQMILEQSGHGTAGPM